MGRLLKMGRKMVGGVQFDGRREQRWCTGDTGERAVCFRKQVQHSGELTPNFDEHARISELARKSA